MCTITIDIANWHRVEDKEVLRTIRDAINYHIKYGFNKGVNVWQDQNRHIELGIMVK